MSVSGTETSSHLAAGAAVSPEPEQPTIVTASAAAIRAEIGAFTLCNVLPSETAISVPAAARTATEKY